MEKTENRVAMVTYYGKTAKTVLSFSDRISDSSLKNTYTKIMKESGKG